MNDSINMCINLFPIEAMNLHNFTISLHAVNKKLLVFLK